MVGLQIEESCCEAYLSVLKTQVIEQLDTKENKHLLEKQAKDLHENP